jgi:cytoskeletal protein CcmA (bactofilin family)
MWRKQNDSQSSAGGTPERTPAITPTVSEPHSRSPEPVAVVSQPRPAPPAAVADSRVARGMKLKGEVSSEANLHVDGVIEGKVHLSGADLTIGPTGLLEGDAESRDIHVLGKVRGNLNAGGCVRLGPSSEVMGDVTAPRLVIEDGAQFNGRIEMRTQESARPSNAAGNGSYRSGTVAHFVREGI